MKKKHELKEEGHRTEMPFNSWYYECACGVTAVGDTQEQARKGWEKHMMEVKE